MATDKTTPAPATPAPTAQEVKFSKDVHKAKATIEAALQELERAWPSHMAVLSYASGDDGVTLHVKERPHPTLTYRAKAGVTVPVGKSNGAANLPPPANG